MEALLKIKKSVDELSKKSRSVAKLINRTN